MAKSEAPKAPKMEEAEIAEDEVAEEEVVS